MEQKERVSVKVTRLNPSLWGCRIFLDGEPYLEGRVKSRDQISGAIKCLLRTIDKFGGIDSPMADSSRHRTTTKYVQVKHIWLKNEHCD